MAMLRKQLGRRPADAGGRASDQHRKTRSRDSRSSRRLGLCVGKAGRPRLFGRKARGHYRCGGFFTRDGKWAVENEGVGPDIDVENFPKDVIAGRDPQLERAVSEALRMLKEKPVDRMMKEPPPPTWGKRKIG